MAFEVMTLTEKAAERVRMLTEGQGERSGLRVGIKKGGCAGMEYTMAIACAPEPYDDVVETNGARVYIDPGATLFLLGTVLDVEVTKLTSGFVFNNPNQVSSCGCGESVELKPVSME